MNGSSDFRILRPRRGITLRVLIIARISTVHQDKRSLEDQIELCKEYIRRIYSGPVEFVVISGQGSGEILDRAEHLEAIERVESGEFDVVITEDLARICRRAHATIFCETCEDANTRFIAINDSIDTAKPDWHLGAFFASVKHELANKDTSLRIRRSLRNRFANGGVVQTFPFGFIKAPGAKSDDDVRLDESAIPIYREWFRRAKEGAPYWEIADWLNSSGIPTGPYCDLTSWTGPMVSRVMHNPILKGWRRRNDRKSRRTNKSGHRVSEKAPDEELLIRKCPHLAVFSEDEYDEILAVVDLRNGHYRRKKVDGCDPLLGVSRRDSRWPRQHFTCARCGRELGYDGHGQKNHLVCSGAKKYLCWNSISVDAPVAAEKIIAAVCGAIEELPGFDAALVEKVRGAAEKRRHNERKEGADNSRCIAANLRQIDNVIAAIGASGHSESLLSTLHRLETDRDELLRRQKRLLKEEVPRTTLPSIEEIRATAAKKFAELAVTSPEFARWMKVIISRLEMQPVRLCDGGTPEPRAYVSLDLTPLVPTDVGTAAADVLRVELVVDLFVPPQRVLFRQEIEELTIERHTQREIAKKLGIHVPTVQRARALTRKMAELGLDDPYVLMTEPPQDYPKIRRHLHPRYRFEPLEGFQPRQ